MNTDIQSIMGSPLGPADLPLTYVTDLLRVVLENNYFEFYGKYYHNWQAKQMGRKLVSS